MIKYDTHLISSLENYAIDHGFAYLDVHDLILSVSSSEEQIAEGKPIFDACKRNNSWKPWDDYREIVRCKKGAIVQNVVEAISQKFKIYQYKKDGIKYDERWDLFFWCNHSYTHHENRDYSYVKLSFNKDPINFCERQTIFKNVIDFIEDLNPDIDITVQHVCHLHEEKIASIIRIFCEENLDQFIDYDGDTGKIRRAAGGEFGFFKKGAKNYGSKIGKTNLTILKMALGNTYLWP